MWVFVCPLYPPPLRYYDGKQNVFECNGVPKRGTLLAIEQMGQGWNLKTFEVWSRPVEPHTSVGIRMEWISRVNFAILCHGSGVCGWSCQQATGGGRGDEMCCMMHGDNDSIQRRSALSKYLDAH